MVDRLSTRLLPTHLEKWQPNPILEHDQHMPRGERQGHRWFVETRGASPISHRIWLTFREDTIWNRVGGGASGIGVAGSSFVTPRSQRSSSLSEQYAIYTRLYPP